MMKSRAFRVKREDAMSHVGGYFILLDITDASKGKPGDYVP
jgi:2-keto-4-pentenoate hydratase/2-oxohepta-3-ene-1,7-dioic acid hydratase in catechol pathway